ncbi:unnamed protein product, partial [Staurois parvus]
MTVMGMYRRGVRRYDSDGMYRRGVRRYDPFQGGVSQEGGTWWEIGLNVLPRRGNTGAILRTIKRPAMRRKP